MKTFGLFMLILLLNTVFWGLMGVPKTFSNGEQFISILLESWIFYKLIKEDISSDK